MSGLLWNKPGVETDDAVMRFLAGADVILDRELFPFDLRATAAHARGLGMRGWLPADEVSAIEAALEELGALFDRGEFILDDRFEDGHSAIESFLTDRLGALAGLRLGGTGQAHRELLLPQPAEQHPLAHDGEQRAGAAAQQLAGELNVAPHRDVLHVVEADA